jgi:hypothetical protein
MANQPGSHGILRTCLLIATSVAVCEPPAFDARAAGQARFFCLAASRMRAASRQRAMGDIGGTGRFFFRELVVPILTPREG